MSTCLELYLRCPPAAVATVVLSLEIAQRKGAKEGQEQPLDEQCLKVTDEGIRYLSLAYEQLLKAAKGTWKQKQVLALIRNFQDIFLFFLTLSLFNWSVVYFLTLAHLPKGFPANFETDRKIIWLKHATLPAKCESNIWQTRAFQCPLGDFGWVAFMAYIIIVKFAPAQWDYRNHPISRSSLADRISTARENDCARPGLPHHSWSQLYQNALVVGSTHSAMSVFHLTKRPLQFQSNNDNNRATSSPFSQTEEIVQVILMSIVSMLLQMKIMC